jgi:hypothetical protein
MKDFEPRSAANRQAKLGAAGPSGSSALQHVRQARGHRRCLLAIGQGIASPANTYTGPNIIHTADTRNR